MTGAIIPSVGDSPARGIYFPENPGGGGADRAFIRYHVEGGETCTFRMGIDNDGDDTLRLWQAGADRVILRDGTVEIGSPNPIRISSGWSGFPDPVTNRAEIANDTGTYKTLMIVGNKAGDGRTRKVGIWDRLEIHGSLFVEGGADIRGGLTVDGVRVVGVKLFSINHPLDPERRLLQHACIEGPEAAVYYRGEGRLSDGVATIELPRYFEALVRKDGRTVQLTPLWEPGASCSPLAASEVKDSRFVVRTVDQKNPDQRFYWEVKAIRADVPSVDIEPLKPQQR